VEGAGAKASRLPPRRVRAFSESLPIPADASRTYRPNPQATTKPAPGPPSLKGYENPKNPFDRNYHLKEIDSVSPIEKLIKVQLLPPLGLTFWRMKSKIVSGRGEKKMNLDGYYYGNCIGRLTLGKKKRKRPGKSNS